MLFTSLDLYIAILSDNLEDFVRAVQKGIPLDMPWQGVTPISYAVNNRRYAMISILVSCGANVNRRSQDDRMEPPLYSACRLNDYEAARILLTSPFVNVNQRNFYNKTPLLAAVNCFSFDIVKLLLDYGADINVARCSEACPLNLTFKYPKRYQSMKIAQLLIRRGIFMAPWTFDLAIRCTIANKDRETFCLLVSSGCVMKRKSINYVSLPLEWQTDEAFRSWMKSVHEMPQSLLHLSKNVIRRALSLNRNIHPYYVSRLQLPNSLKRIIMLDD